MLQITDFLSAFFILFPIKIIKTARYHDATIDMPDLRFFMLLPMNFAKTAQYHDATSDKRFPIFSVYFPYNSQKQLSRMMLQITHATYFSHDVTCSINLTKTARYQDATNNTRHLVFFAVFAMKITKTARYHDATNDRFHLHFS